ncbi:GlsB/YeaQ/YmgE family stress response membrane protein [Pacificimonas sp. WHA3]|uniref:GlsB/YeaQ/YmgE family stress response membrane protein n=1 Tax=Pacificimonas pallii TaxID=2827236 RepID=A0ABS6SC39_9SPHN|nr:GlsB/YeaQ/YmgE family stress response membrane protein [Pacificimonas pallii]MBV7255974.1 GlsB/YeaQ/YmgE family stress response membrane protein [Pacificimonas pallii]
MGWLSYIVVGLIAGALGKLIMPGRDPGGIIVTILIGIAGALVGGFIGSSLLGIGTSGINIPTILIATGGSVLLLFLYRMFKSRSV